MSSITEQSLIEKNNMVQAAYNTISEEIMLSQMAHFMVEILERQMNKRPVCVCVLGRGHVFFFVTTCTACKLLGKIRKTHLGAVF